MVVYRDGLAYFHGGVAKPLVECKWCGGKTHMTATKLCDRCWELESRIGANPELARRMLQEIDNG